MKDKLITKVVRGNVWHSIFSLSKVRRCWTRIKIMWFYTRNYMKIRANHMTSQPQRWVILLEKSPIVQCSCVSFSVFFLIVEKLCCLKEFLRVLAESYYTLNLDLSVCAPSRLCNPSYRARAIQFYFIM